MLIGVIHLPPLPGSPRHVLSMDEIIARALADAAALRDAGFHAAIVENFGDAPFLPGAAEPATLACMAVAAREVRLRSGLRVGVNVLRNDATGALGVAVAAGAEFIRVNIYVGVAATDQGVIEGAAARTLRYRRQLGAAIDVFADVDVKHARSLSHRDIAQAAKDAAYRGLASALIVTGPATGEPVDLDEVRRVKEAVPDRPVLVGSGATAESVRSLLAACDGVIVGTGIKRDRRPESPIDTELAKRFVAAARA